MFMLCRVEKRLPVEKSFDQTKSQHSSVQFGIEEKTSFRYSVSHIGITAAAICCRKDSRCCSKIGSGTVYDVAQTRPFLAEAAMMSLRLVLRSIK